MSTIIPHTNIPLSIIEYCEVLTKKKFRKKTFAAEAVLIKKEQK